MLQPCLTAVLKVGSFASFASALLGISVTMTSRANSDRPSPRNHPPWMSRKLQNFPVWSDETPAKLITPELTHWGVACCFLTVSGRVQSASHALQNENRKVCGDVISPVTSYASSRGVFTDITMRLVAEVGLYFRSLFSPLSLLLLLLLLLLLFYVVVFFCVINWHTV